MTDALKTWFSNLSWGIHFWFLLKMGGQIENEAVQFWRVEQGVQYLKPGKSMAYPSCPGPDLLQFQVLELPSHCCAFYG